MKLIINHGKVKRQINGPYSICGSKHDFQVLYKAIRRAIDGEDFCFGWFDVVDYLPCTPNTKPMNWENNEVAE